MFKLNTQLLFVAVSAAIVLVSLSGAMVQAIDNADRIANLWAKLQSKNVTGMSLSTVSASGFTSDISGAFGFAQVGNSIVMSPATRFRMGAAAELFVATAIFKLIKDGKITFKLDDPIPSSHMPGSISFTNPDFASVPITLRMLLQHTSSLTDNTRWSSAASSTTVSAFATFATAYYVTSAGTTTVQPDIWRKVQPGLQGSYQWARANIGLLMFIIERTVITDTVGGLVSSPDKTCLAYVAENIWLPLGMSDTFVRGVDGKLPTLAATPAGVKAVSAASIVQDMSADNAAITTLTLHPAYFAEQMTYTTMSDVAKLLKALFTASSATTTEEAKFTSLGTDMRSSIVTVSTLTEPTKVSNQQGSAHGLRTFNGADICTLAKATGVVAACPMTATTTVWGVVHTGTYEQVLALCSNGAAKSEVHCHAIAFAQLGGKITTANEIQAAAGVATQLAYGSQSDTKTTSNAASTDALYPLWVVLSVVGCLLFVLIAAFIAEYMVGEAPVSSGLVMPSNSMPQVSKA